MITQRQTLVVVLSLVESFTLSAHYAVFMPFYPNVAYDKGNSASQVGTFFAVGSCVGLIGSPLMGLLLKRGFPPKVMVIFGLLLSGFSLMVHGLYKDFFDDSEEFFYANIATRIVHSIGPVAATTAIYPIVAVELGEKRGTFLPFLEAFYNIGLMIWPSIGAILYEHFGYAFPFVSVGVCSLVICAILVILLPSPEENVHSGPQKTSNSVDIDLSLFLILTNIAICYLIIGFNDITLSTELKKFHLSHTQIGYCFAVATVCYGVCIYLWGLACLSQRGQYLSQAAGYSLSVIGLFFLGPCGFISINPTLHVRLFGQALMGIGLAALFTSSMICGMNYLTSELLLEDNVSTHGFFSSLIFFSLCFGYLVGHAGFAGFLLDILSYQYVVSLIILVVCVASFLNCMNVILFRQASLKSGYQIITGSDSI